MTVHTRNLTHRTILAVEEHQTYRPHPERPQTATTVTTEARIVSSLGAGSYWSMGLAGRVESWGVHRFAKNALRSREGMQWVLDRRASASSETPTATGILRRPFWSASVAEADHHRVDHHHHVVDDGLRPG